MTLLQIIKLLFWISVFLVVYPYILYPLLLIVIDKIHKPVPYNRKDTFPNVTIIIAAYNEEKNIRSRIENCLALDYPQESIQVIIASDGSTDKTNDIVREYSSKRIVLLEYTQRRGKVNVLNDAINHANSNILVFSDANTMFVHDAISRLVSYFNDEKVGCVCGGLNFVNTSGSKTGEMEGIYWRYETMLKKLEGKRGSLLGANGAIFAIRKDLYEKCPEDTIVEDFYIPMKILQKGYAIIFNPDAGAFEEAVHKIVQEKKRRIRIGAGDFQALFRLLPMLNPLRGFPAVAFWSHKVLRWFAPFFLIFSFCFNAALIGEGLYLSIFAMQCLFYLTAFIGQVLSWSGVSIKIFNLCYYFVSMNLALLLGFVRFVSKTQEVTWERTER